MNLLIILIKALCFAIFCVISAFTLMFGKPNTGVKMHYVLTSIFLWGVIFIL